MAKGAQATGLGTIIAPGHAAASNAASDTVATSLAPDSWYNQSGNIGVDQPGSIANNILTGAANVGAQNIAVDYTNLDRDNAALGAQGDVFSSYFHDGGLMEAAARNAAMARAGEAQGGSAGVQNLVHNVQANAADVSQTGTQERAAMGQNANAMTAQQLALQLKKQIFQAAVSHANTAKNMEAQGLQNSVGVMQQQNNLQLQRAGTSAAGSAAETALQTNKSNFNNTMAIAQAAIGGGAQGAGALTQAFNRPTAAAPSFDPMVDATTTTGGYQLSSPVTGMTYSGAQYANPQSEVMADNTTQQSTQAPSQYSWLTTSLA